MENIINMQEMMRQKLFDRGTDTDRVNYNAHADVQPERFADIDMTDNNMSCNLQLGICSVPMQEWEQVYDEDTAYSAGTIFPCLNKPFLGGGK